MVILTSNFTFQYFTQHLK